MTNTNANANANTNTNANTNDKKLSFYVVENTVYGFFVHVGPSVHEFVIKFCSRFINHKIGIV